MTLFLGDVTFMVALDGGLLPKGESRLIYVGHMSEVLVGLPNSSKPLEVELGSDLLSTTSLLEAILALGKMTSLSEDDRKTIKDHPLNDSLDRLQRSLLDVEHSLDRANDIPEHICQEAVSRLLAALQNTEAAFVLWSRISSCDVASEIAHLFARVRNGDFSYTHYRPLVKLIIQKASDYDIWSAILDLITTLSRVTPTPASVPPTFDNTPITHSSASQQGSEQTWWLIEARVFEEIRSCTY
uniref:Uncharacterized protein n=1 Tax=Coccidioides posadasii RMSCC 3488 TaxID=454284 RepID=A0A0J6FQD1_COCPO|nr:hypothetical protein CPAG_07968 [Coccidioides posadasii RMSCC 3488]